MGLFSSSKKSSTTTNTRTETNNQAVEEGGIALSGSGTFTLTDQGAVDAGIGAAVAGVEATRDVADLALAAASETSASLIKSNQAALQSGFEAFARADQTETEAILTDTQKTIRILIIAAVAAVALPSVMEMLK